MESDDKKKSQEQDKYTLSYTFWTFTVFLLVNVYIILDWVFNFPISTVLFYAVLSIGVIVIIWAIIMLIALFRNIYRGNWCRVYSLVAAPIIVAIFFGLLFDKNRIRLEYNKASYMKEVAEIQVSDGSPRLKTWNWGSSGFAVSAGCDYSLVYDESDQIGLRPSNKSNHRNVIITHIEGHFYLVEDWTW